MNFSKTQKCIVDKCEADAVSWNGFLIKSRDKIDAGFCNIHMDDTKCHNAFGKKDCYGIYNKNLGEIENQSSLSPSK